MGTEGKTMIIPAAVLDQVGGKLWVRIWAPSTEGFYRVGFSFVQYCQRQLERMEEFKKLNRVSHDSLDHSCPQVGLVEKEDGFVFDPIKNRIVFTWDQAAKFDFSAFLPTTVRHMPVYFVLKDKRVAAMWQNGLFVWVDDLSWQEGNAIQKGFDLSYKSPRVPEVRLVHPVKEENKEVATTSGMFFF